MKKAHNVLLSCTTALTLASCAALDNPMVTGIIDNAIGRSGNAAAYQVWQLVKGIHANQMQIQAAQRRAAYASEQAKARKVRYAAVKVPKADDGNGDRVMIIDSQTGKPKDDKTYAVQGGASKGEAKKIGGVEATVVDNIGGL